MKNIVDSRKKYIMKRKSNGGFTLVELLAMIALLSIISVIAIYTSTSIIGNIKNKSYMVTINNIQEEASTYILENNKNIFWHSDNNGYFYQCITIQNLIDMGYFDNTILDSKIGENRKVLSNDYVYIEKDKETNVITRSILLYEENSEYSSLCGDYVKSSGDIVIDVPSGWKKEKEVVITYKLDSSLGDSFDYSYGYSFGEDNDNYEKYKFNNVRTVSQSVTIQDNGTLYAHIVKKDGSPLVTDSTEIIGIDNLGPDISVGVNDGIVSGNATIQIEITDVGSGVDDDSVDLEDFQVKVGNNTLTSGLSLERISNDNYNLNIENYDYEGDVVIYIAKDKILDKVLDEIKNGNDEKIFSTGIVFVNEYTISYNANGGAGSISNMKCTYGKECTLTKNTYERTGYKFLGWSTDKNATSVMYVDEYRFEQFEYKNDITLYAIWQDNTPPTCTLSVTTSGIEFATVNDNVGVVSQWLSTSSTATTGSTSLTLSAGTKYGFVKDEAGNVGKCDVYIVNANRLYTCSRSATKNYSSFTCDASNYSNPSGACGNKVYLSNSCLRYNYWQANYSECVYDSSTGEYKFLSRGFESGRESCATTYGICNASTVGTKIVSSCTKLSSYYYDGLIRCYSYSCGGASYSDGKCYLYKQTSCSSEWSISGISYACYSNYPNKVGIYCY